MDDSVEIRQVIFYIVRLAASTVAGIYLVNKLVEYLDPTNAQKKKSKLVAEQILKHVGINAKVISELTEYEMMIATHVISSDTGVTWNDVGGYASEINELQDNIILPLRLSCSSKVFSPPKGVLLYGPPGCGKTLIAKALASAAGATFINLQISTLTDKWYGESNKLASAVFSLARKLQPSIIFIDEIDSFLRSRASDDHEATAMMKALFMSLWEGFSTDAHNRIIILGATNRPQDVDAAILRRMPTKYYIGLPDEYQRRLIFQVILKNELLEDSLDLQQLAEDTKGFSGSDLREISRLASIFRVKDCILSGNELDSCSNIRPLSITDFQKAIERCKRSNQILGMQCLGPD